MIRASRIHPLTGKPYRAEATQQRVRLESMPRRIAAAYDAARTTSENQNYWANADSLDADSANSRGVRSVLVRRARYEVANNGFADGIVQTLAVDIVGSGPKLRMQTPTKGFNQAVELVWSRWAKAIQFRRKLWTMAHAKVQDGESIGILRTNPKVRDRVKLDVVLIETEQCQNPYLEVGAIGRIDGIKFDEFGNPETYYILKQHPGGSFAVYNADPEEVDASLILHWFACRRAGQHRGVPEFKSTLNVGAGSRRFREATLASAETAAEFSVLLKTLFQPDEIDAVSPMSTLEVQKRMMTALPMGWDATQMRAEHPNATYEAFLRSQLNEQSRPKSMPYNKAACDSSSYNYASGRLDHQTYYSQLDTDRWDCDDTVLEPLFREWWREAVSVYQWAADPNDPPLHSWQWPTHPVADINSESTANDRKLRNGSITLSQLYAESGQDYDDAIQEMAADYGVSEDEMREILRSAIFNSQNQQASMQQAQTAADASEATK